MTKTTITRAPRTAKGRSSAAPHFTLAPIPSQAAQGLRADSHDVWVYLAGSTALKLFMQQLGATAYKVGTSGRRDLNDRIRDLRRKRYAGAFCSAQEVDGPARELPHADEWFQVPILPSNLAGVAMPEGIRLEGNALRLTLPRSVSAVAFDEAVRALLRPRALDAFLASPDGRARLEAAGFDPDGRLMTTYDLIGAPRRSVASELYLVRPSREMPALVAALAELMARMARGEREFGKVGSRGDGGSGSGGRAAERSHRRLSRSA